MANKFHFTNTSLFSNRKQSWNFLLLPPKVIKQYKALKRTFAFHILFCSESQAHPCTENASAFPGGRT